MVKKNQTCSSLWFFFFWFCQQVLPWTSHQRVVCAAFWESRHWMFFVHVFVLNIARFGKSLMLAASLEWYAAYRGPESPYPRYTILRNQHTISLEVVQKVCSIPLIQERFLSTTLLVSDDVFQEMFKATPPMTTELLILRGHLVAYTSRSFPLEIFKSGAPV